MDLSRIARGGTPITLDRPRLLFFDMAALWLLIQKYGHNYLQQLYGVPAKNSAAKGELVLNSMDALHFYLWIGLQADCKLRGEELTMEQVGEFITPLTFPRIFNLVITAFFRDTLTPARKDEAEGKAEAAAARPAVVAEARPAKAKRSTSRKKSGSRSARSDGRPKGSGQAASLSTT